VDAAGRTDDKRCVIEARPAGAQSVAVTHHGGRCVQRSRAETGEGAGHQVLPRARPQGRRHHPPHGIHRRLELTAWLGGCRVVDQLRDSPVSDVRGETSGNRCDFTKTGVRAGTSVIWLAALLCRTPSGAARWWLPAGHRGRAVERRRRPGRGATGWLPCSRDSEIVQPRTEFVGGTNQRAPPSTLVTPRTRAPYSVTCRMFSATPRQVPATCRPLIGPQDRSGA
jgi:hypothetical protein